MAILTLIRGTTTMRTNPTHSPGLAVLLAGLFILLSAGCEADPAAVLDEPRFLAVQADPPRLAEDQPVALEALTFQMGDELRWQWCPSNWVSPPLDSDSDALLCSSGDAVSLGVGPTVTLDPPNDLSSLWILVEAPEGVEALPAVRLLEATGAEANPEITAIIQLGPQPAPPAGVEEEISLAVAFGPDETSGDHVATWYVTAGELLPNRSVGEESVTFTTPSTPGGVEVVVVVRGTDGGVSWLTRTIEVGE
ncbi:MAG: hypothetical protein ACI9MR_002964 [Myxococcota bacterium]|jgi:hypothetical protein